MKITHEERFTEMEMFRMFNVEVLPGGERKHSSRAKATKAKYAFNDILVPLWKETKRKLTRGEKAACQNEDHIKPGVSLAKPGSQRVADLARFYSENADEEKSAFSV